MKETIEEILVQMDEKFERHKLLKGSCTEDGKAGYYILRDPDSSSYWFQVGFLPGRIITISGDIAPFLIAGKDLAWLLSTAPRYPGDILRHLKASRQGEQKFDHEAAALWLAEYQKEILKDHDLSEDEISDFSEIQDEELNDTLEAIEEAKEFLSECSTSEVDHALFQRKISHFVPYDFELDFLQPDNQVLWKIAALRCFSRLLPKNASTNDFDLTSVGAAAMG